MQPIKTAIASADLSTRGKRRKTVTLIAGLLERIRTAEEAFMEGMPLNLQGSDAFVNTEYSIALIDEAIDVISSIYD